MSPDLGLPLAIWCGAQATLIKVCLNYNTSDIAYTTIHETLQLAWVQCIRYNVYTQCNAYRMHISAILFMHSVLWCELLL